MPIDHRDRLEALDNLLDARMAHTRWVSEAVHATAPCVAEDHRQCAFGKWLSSVGGDLRSLPEFAALAGPHEELHLAYQAWKACPDRSEQRHRIRTLSGLLIDRIDLLEKRLNRPGHP